MKRAITDNLKHHDPFMVLADYQAYVDCQHDAGRANGDTAHWGRMAILKVARMGMFSSDRSIVDYARDISKASALPVSL